MSHKQNNTSIDWKPIDTFDKDDMHRIPVFVCDPAWYDSRCSNANVAMGYWDKYLDGGRWNITMFESASHYAWVTYNYDCFKPKFFAAIPAFVLPTV